MTSVYEQYGLKKVINASGRMTILGVSTPSAAVVERVSYGLNHYFEIGDLVNKTGAHIARLLGCESALVVSCASAGLAQCVAAAIVQDDDWLLHNLHIQPLLVADEIVMAKGHNVSFGAPVGTMVALGGGRLIEAGYANECSPQQLSAAVTTQTAAILYIKSHHCVQKSHLSVQQALEVAQQHGVPLIVDAAAEEDLQAWSAMGADLVIYSGAKAIEGPTSGLVIGKQQPVEWVKRQAHGIGRARKVGKEGILGLTLAIENYLTQQKVTGAQMVEKMTTFIAQLNGLQGIGAQVVWDSAGRDIARAEIHIDEKTTGRTTSGLVQALKSGDPAIYFRGYKANEGIIEVDVRSVSASELVLIFTCLRRQINQEK